MAGESGIGKTALLEAFQERCRGVRWLWGVCDGLLTPRPLGPLFDIGPQAGGELAELCRVGAPRDRLFAAFLRELSGPAALTVVAMEDLHWADEATIDLLSFLGRRLGRMPALLLVTYRDDELGEDHPLRMVLGDLATQRATWRMRLPPLSVHGVRLLAGERGVDAAELHEITGGNPFYVTEMLEAGLALSSADGPRRGGGPAGTFRAVRRTVEAAAVIGSSIPIASGRYPHNRVISPPRPAPALSSGRPATRASSAAASSGGRASRLITVASSTAVSRRRLVISTRLPAVPGSSGRTWWCPAASSSSSRIFLPATKSRHRPARASSPGGICAAGTPAVSNRLASASAGPTGRCIRVWACSGRKNCPSGKSAPAGARHAPRRWSCRSRPSHRSRECPPPRRWRPGRQRRHQPGELGLAAGEAGDIARQRPGRHRGKGSRRRCVPGRQHLGGRGLAAGRRDKQLTRRPVQPQPIGQQQRGVLVRGAVDAPLQVTDRPRAHARRLRQLLLRQPGLGPQLPQQPGERKPRLLRHRPHPLVTTHRSTLPGRTDHAPTVRSPVRRRHLLPPGSARGQAATPAAI